MVSVSARCWSSPGLLLADEPTSQLDTDNRDKVVRLLARITSTFGTTVVAVTHDPAVAAALGRQRDRHRGSSR